jgi:type III pantothenate kinase
LRSLLEIDKLKLIADFGNTLMKLAVFEGKRLAELGTFANGDTGGAQAFILGRRPFENIILSSVTDVENDLMDLLRTAGPLTTLTHETPVPLRNLYETPETLGHDRLAAAVGARAMFYGENVLSIDAGTCITYDFVTASGDYLGGGISPGIRMRFRAMNTFTGKLPLVEPDDFERTIGRNTRESILSGVINGVIQEIRGITALYISEFGEIRMVLTGGDHEFLHNKLKINIFAAPNLVLLGLNEILDYHG